ncbi:MAG: hypothetical protein ACYS0I_15895 [Planctomycetota bacterium]|jgi:hypothetical protein
MAEKNEENKISTRNISWQLFLIVVPWLVFLAVDSCWAGMLIWLFGSSIRAPVFVSLAPFEVLLIVGIIIAWKRGFPLWSYTWIGILYFFGYREIFEIVLQFAPRFLPENSDAIIFGFYWIVNPLALALLLALITRRDWLFACFTAYPYGSIIQVWYTLDWSQMTFLILFVSFFLYAFFALLFMALKSRPLKFISLLAGTLVIGGGFFLYQWDLLIRGLPGFVFVNVRHVLIIAFPLIIYKIPLYRKLFKAEQLQVEGG